MSDSLLAPSQTLAIDPETTATTTIPSSTSNSNTATATILQNIPPALFFIVPAFSVALLVVAITHRPQHGSSPSRPQRAQAKIAYTLVAALGALSTIAGAIPLGMAGINSDLRSEKVVEALVSLLLGVPVLHLASTRSRRQSARRNVLHLLHTGALAMTLSSATLLTLLVLFLPTPGTALYIPPALFLVFSVLALPRLVQALSSVRHPDSNSVHFFTPSPSKPSWFFRSGTSPHLNSASAGNRRKPITIHVATHRTSSSYPLSLPSPSSSNSFPLTESVSSHEHEQLELGCNSLRQHNYRPQGELEISLPCRNSDREFEQERNRNSQAYSYHDLHSEHTGRHSKEKLQLGRRQQDNHKVELHRSSVDSSSSTLTTNTDRKLERASSFNRVLTPPPLTRIRLPTIASAGSSNVELQFSNSTSNQGIIELASVPNSIRFGNLFTGNIDNRSTRTGRTTSIHLRTSSTSTHHHHGEPYQRGLLGQLRFTRARSCLVFLIAAQVTALVAYACAIGVEAVSEGYQSGVIVGQSAPQPNWGTLTLRIVQTACTVLSVTGTMSAYFLHAYNEHPLPSTGGIDVRTHDHTPNGIATNTTATAMISGGVRPPKPAGSRPNPHSHSSGTIAISTNTTPAGAASTFVTPGEVGSSDAFTSSTDNAHSNESENDVHAVPHDMYMAYGPRSPSYAYGVSSFNGGDGYEGVQGGRYVDTPGMVAPATHTLHHQTPVLVDPLSHTRKRVDAMMGGGPQKLSISMPSIDASPAGGGVDLNGDADALALASSPLSRQERFSYGLPSSATGQPFIHLTYVPPKNAEDNSLFETDTELEGDVRSEDLEFETEMEEGFQEEQEQETEMDATMLSRSKSTAPGSGGTRPMRGRMSRRASVGVVAVDLHRRRSVGYAVNHSTGKKPESTPHSSGSSRPRIKAKPSDDPSVYIRRRGTLPGPSSSKKFFGWEFGSDPVPPEKKIGGGGLRRNWTERVGAGSRCAMARDAVNDFQQGQESSFIDLRGDNGYERGVGLGLGRKTGNGSGGKEERKVEGGGGGAEPEKSQIERAPRRKLKKRSKSSSSTADSGFEPPVSRSKRTSITRPLSVVLPAAAPIGISPASQSKSGGFSFGRLGHHRFGSGSSSSRPGTADSQASKVSYGSTSGMDVVKRGLQLKKSFKLGVGRTLGPNLTLAVGMPSKAALESTVRKAKWRTSSIVAESIPEGDDDDDDEMESIAAAKLVSASIARATPASTILATPTSGGDLPVKGRPTLAVIITSLPSSSSSSGNTDVASYPFSAPGLPDSSDTPLTNSSPASGKMPAAAPNRWKPHPFADFVEGNKATRNHIAEVANDVEDDVVQLEHEMEAIRGRRGDIEKDSPRKLRAAGGILQKRVASSSPPSPKSEWAPQPSSASPTAGGFRFPMIFGNDPPSNMYQHAQQSSSQVRLQTSSTPSTPRGQSTIRLSAVRNAFAGVGARMSSRTSVNSNAPSPMRGDLGSRLSDMVMETNDGDFMDLRDPFASPPAAATLVTPTKKTLKNGAKAKEGDNFLVIGPNDVEGGDGRRRMSAWGKLPMPTRPFSPAANPGASTVGAKRNTNSSNRSGRSGAKVAAGHRKQKKEKRARKTTLPSMASALSAMKGVALRIGEEDADFGIEEALLSQRLLKRLDADGWESRA